MSPTQQRLRRVLRHALLLTHQSERHHEPLLLRMPKLHRGEAGAEPTGPELRAVRGQVARQPADAATPPTGPRVGREAALMARPYKFAQVDRATIERALANSQGVLAAADYLGMSGNHLYKLMRSFGIAPPPRQARQPRPRRPAEQHPPTAAIATELAELRTQARLLLRTYGPCPHRMRELLRIEARHRYLLALLRGALGPAEASDTRERSPVIFSRGIASPT